MHPFLRDKSHFIAALAARQTGKTFNGVAKLLHIALTYPESTIIVTAPKHDQVKRIAFKHLQTHLLRLKTNNPTLYRKLVPTRGIQRTIIRLKNSSTILAESPIPETIRGHTAKAVYLMEANFIRDDMDLYTAVLFTLNTTNGTAIAYTRRLQKNWTQIHVYNCDQTGIGDPIIEDMTRSGITNTQGTVFTQPTPNKPIAYP